MEINLNDKPIQTSKNDLLRFDGLVDAIFNQIMCNSTPEGALFAIYGNCGAGKK